MTGSTDTMVLRFQQTGNFRINSVYMSSVRIVTALS
jgi:hypothetical protein